MNMIEKIRYSISGPREKLEQVQERTGLPGKLTDWPARSNLLIEEVIRGTEEYHLLEDLIAKYELDPFRLESFMATDEELSTEPLLCNYECFWFEDITKDIKKPVYTERDACPHCGKGMAELAEPIQGHFKRYRKYNLLRYPPGLFIGSSRLAAKIRELKCTGVEIRPVIERKTGEPSEFFNQLVITSILPPMHPSAPIKRWLKLDDACEKCRRIGFCLECGKPQPVYSKRVLDVAADWNISHEWLAPHYVSCPELICRREVVHELMKLDCFQKWIPVILKED